MITKFIILPRFGNTAKGYDMGKMRGRTSQLDVINHYTKSFVRHLELNGICHELISNDSGMDEKDRLPLIPAGAMVIVCGCGVSKHRNGKKNYSSVVAFGSKNRKFGQFFLDGMNDWGRSLNYHHGSQKPIIETDNPYIKSFPQQIPILEIRPFQIGAPGIDDYWLKIEELGFTLVESIREIIRVDCSPRRKSIAWTKPHG